MATGFADVDSDAYKRYFDQQGRMLTGWQTISTGTYYFRESGAMQTGTATIGGRQYTFSDNGTLVK
jgi:glucan-binding YG repeat protein